MVTFETKVWEKDWAYILKGDYLDKMIASCNFNFSKKHLIINNVKDRDTVESYCRKKVEQGIIDDFFVVEDYEVEVLNYFGISRESFEGGYYYSIAELVGIYLCETNYLLHFSGDSFIGRNAQPWIDDAISILNANPNIYVANPTWNNKFGEAAKESFSEIENFWLGYGFSDQVYLIKADNFKQKIYDEKNVHSDRYPKYGGELFEKRVDAFMRNKDKHRITHKFSSYTSKNFPKKWIARKWLRFMIVYFRLLKMQR